MAIYKTMDWNKLSFFGSGALPLIVFIRSLINPYHFENRLHVIALTYKLTFNDNSLI